MERLLSFSVLIYIFTGTGLNKNNFLHQYTQGRCMFQRYLQAQLLLSGSPVLRMHIPPAQEKLQSKLDNLSVVCSTLMAVWCFLNLNRKLSHHGQFSRIHLWASPCRALKTLYCGRHNMALTSLADFKPCMVHEIIFL